MSRRTERVEEMLREEISILLQRELKDPRLGFVTVTGADVSPDLRHAKVFVSVLGTVEEKEHSLEALERARGFLRKELGRRSRLKSVPDLVFREDEASVTGNRIFALLEEVRSTEEAAPIDTQTEPMVRGSSDGAEGGSSESGGSAEVAGPEEGSAQNDAG